MQHRTIYALCSLKYFLLINWVYTDLTSRISPTTIICSLRLHWQVNFDYTFRFTPTTLSDSLQIHSFVHSAYTSKLTLTTSLCLLRLQLLVHSDLAILEPFFSITPVGRFWLVKTYQYGWHPSVLSHHALGTAECDESYCIEGTIFGRSFVGVRGFFLPWVILRRKRHHDNIWIFEHSNSLRRQFRGGVMPLYGKWVCLWPYMGTPQFFRLHKTDHTQVL